MVGRLASPAAVAWYRNLEAMGRRARDAERHLEAAAAAGGLPITPDEARRMLDRGMTREQIRAAVNDRDVSATEPAEAQRGNTEST